MAVRLRLDPWAPEYGAALQLDDEEAGETPVEVSCGVELPCAEWRPLTPAPAPRPSPLAFVDGAERLHARVTLEAEGETGFGALASVAVGAVRVDETSACVLEPIQVERTLALSDPRRLVALAGPEVVQPLEVPCGSMTLCFVPRAAERTGRDAWREALQGLRRDLEQALGQRLAGEGYGLVVLDGVLRLRPAPSTPVVGYTKALYREYLREQPAEVRSTPRMLRAGQRSPLFLIEEKEPRLSWYLRLSEPRTIDHSLAGIVRLETVWPEIEVDQARRIADQTALYLPELAAPPERDPRAPQNLLPIGGLEARLRHEIGDPLWLRRAIEQHLFREAP